MRAEEYRKLRSILRNEYRARVPHRCAVPSPEDAGGVSAAALEALEDAAAETEAEPSGPVAPESGYNPG
jgi:hypothetical protein